MTGESGFKKVVLYAFAVAVALLDLLILIRFPRLAVSVTHPASFLILAIPPLAALVIVSLIKSPTGIVGAAPAVPIPEQRAVTPIEPEAVKDVTAESVSEIPALTVANAPAPHSELLKLCDDSPHIYCVADFSGQVVEANEAAKTLYRLAGLERGGTSWYSMIHPEDQHRTAMAITTLLSGDSRISSFRNRIKLGDSYRWMDWTAISKGNVRRVYIVGQDVTEFQNAFLALSDSELRFRVAFNSMHEGMVLVDSEGRLSLINHTAKKILSMTQEDGEGQKVFSTDLKMLREDGSHLPPTEHPLAKALATGQPQSDLIVGIHAKGGDLRWIEANAVPLFHHGENKPYAAVSTLNDVTDSREINGQIQSYLVTLEFQKEQLEVANARLEEANHQLQMLATTDALTGLRNHRAFQERLVEEIMRAERYKTPLALILLDVDQFKSYNDSFGHPAGDEVLRRLSDILRDHARTHDLAARYGGEEFILLTPHTDIAGAEIVAERCRHAIEKVQWSVRPVTASFGVAALGYGIETGAELIACADHALYAAKAGGRNRVCTYSPALGKTAHK